MNKTQRELFAKKSLKGLSVGDAFGESFFGETDKIMAHIQHRTMPETTWEFTDDTVMAIAIYEQVIKNQSINQQQLIQKFIHNHNKDVNRGYGATLRRVLREIEEGKDWRAVAQNVFDGMGSMGNGAAMRVSPIGAYFFDDLKKVKELTIQSAEITHTNIEGIAGAIAVAIATALATRIKLEEYQISPIEFINKIAQELPDTDTKSKIQKSITIPYDYHIKTIKSILGNGSKMIAQDTVPFAIWCAAHNLNSFEEALWKAVSILGDRDTICAIVGGITIISSTDIPKKWFELVEDFETSVFLEKI